MSKTMWMVRAGEGGMFIDDFVSGGYVALGWGDNVFSGMPERLSREQVVAAFREAQPDWKLGRISNAAGQFYRFVSDIHEGDLVLTADPTRRLYYVGAIESAAHRVASNESPFRRKVRWDSQVLRDELSVATRNTLGSTLTLFRIGDEAATELLARRQPIGQAPRTVPTPPDETKAQDATAIDDLRQEIREKASEFIADMIGTLDPYDLQDLVAGILRAMGYKTRVSAKGPDRGVDIFASPDGLGLQEPRIFVEVKHRRGTQMGSNELRSFLGGRKQGDRCLYVSTGGFTREARYEADRANIPLTLLDLTDLQNLVQEHYERLDEETRRLVPLTKLYWPIHHDA